MNSAGFDLVVEIHRQLYNKILEDVYRTNPIIATKKRGLYSYELKLDNPPTVDHFTENYISFTIDLNAKIKLLSLFSINMDSIAHLLVSIQSDKASKKLEAKILESKLTMKPRRYDNFVLSQFLKLYYSLLNLIIDSRLAHHYEKIALSPSLYSFTLPELEKEELSSIEVGISDIATVNEDVTAILINFLGGTNGSRNLLTDFTAGQDISFSLSADAMKKVKKYWWGNPNRPITDEAKGILEIKPDIFLELLTRLGLALDDLLEKHTLPINYEVKTWWIDYRIKAKLSEPELVLKEGNELEVPGLEIRLDIDAKLQLSNSAPNENNEGQTMTAATFTERDLELIVREASASIHLDNNYRIVAKLVKLDTTLNLNWGFPPEVLDLFIDRVEEHIIHIFSDIIISPAIITENIPGTGLQFKFDVSRIETSQDEITIGGSIEPTNNR